MTVFYINQEKSNKSEWEDKFDFGKFIDGKSDVPEDTKLKIKKAIGATEQWH